MYNNGLESNETRSIIVKTIYTADMNEAKKKLGEMVDEQLAEAIAILEKTKKYFGVVFDPNDDAMMAEMKRQIRLVEYDEKGVKRNRQALRKRCRKLTEQFKQSKAKAKKKAESN